MAVSPRWLPARHADSGCSACLSWPRVSRGDAGAAHRWTEPLPSWLALHT